MDEAYLTRLTEVLVSNYWGEVLIAELISKLLQQRDCYRHRQVLARLLLDETRHANLLRSLLHVRGRIGRLQVGRHAFVYHRLFQQLRAEDVAGTLIFLTEFEAQSGPTFHGLIQLGLRRGDHALATLYSEILNDEVRHAGLLEGCLPVRSPASEALRAQARKRFRGVLNRAYLELYASQAAKAEPVPAENA
jgi:hypothetical protein